MSTRKKKKHVCSCGETFNHGIGLRKHQRQTGHKGSKIVEDGEDAGPAAAPPNPAQPEVESAPPAPPPSAPIPAAPEAPAPKPSLPEEPDNDRTVVVRGPGGSTPTLPGSPTRADAQDPGLRSRLAHQRQKASLVGRGLRILLAYRAKSAGTQLKRSARSGADIFTEALKLAVALLCFLGLPSAGLYWWHLQRTSTAQNAPSPAPFSYQDGALAARSDLLTYFDRLAKKNFEVAYGMLSGPWQQEMSQRTFRDAFLDIEDFRWAVVDQRLLPDGRAEVETKLAFQEGGQPRLFDARFLMVPQGSNWRVDRAEILREVER